MGFCTNWSHCTKSAILDGKKAWHPSLASYKTSYKNFLSGHFPQSMFLNLATQEEIIDTASKFPAGKSAGYDNIPMSVKCHPR